MSATGSLGVRAVLEDEATEITGVRWTYRLTGASAPCLLFQWAQLGDGGHRALEHPIHPYTFRVADGASSGWPPPADKRAGQLGTPWLGCSNFAGEPMDLERPSRPMRYPRATWGVDGIAEAVKPTAVGQGSVLGRDVHVTFARLRRADHWRLSLDAGRADLDVEVVADLYRAWSIRPSEALAFITEFFDQDGGYSWASWDHAVRQGGRWRPVRTFVAHYVPPPAPGTTRTFGFAASGDRLVLRKGLPANQQDDQLNLRR